jgi:hypothetical protein
MLPLEGICQLVHCTRGKDAVLAGRARPDDSLTSESPVLQSSTSSGTSGRSMTSMCAVYPAIAERAAWEKQ